MIKLDTSYSLGSIIESNFLGISNDAEPDNVIVTLSKNMVTCFHMPSQKQVHCWSSSDKLSSGVIFDPSTNCYYGVFNYTRIGKWLQSSLMMKDMKKFNFTSKIVKHLTRLDYKGAIAVFENGHCECLKEAIGNRKKIRDAVINDCEIIELAKLCIFRTKATCIIVSVDNKNIKTLRSVPLEADTFLPINLQIYFKNKTDKLLGYCVRENVDSLNVLTFWSNGYLYSNELYAETNSNDFPGKQLTEITLINSKKQVSLIQLSSDCIGLYGAEPKGDGAALVIYNFHYNMVVAVKHFKIYTNPPNLWCFGNHLLLVTGQNLAVIPFTRERNNLSLLMDNNLIKINDKYEETEWDSYAKQKCVDTISTSALSQSKLNEMIITDHVINKKDKSLIRLLAENNDISDNSLVEILLYCSLNITKHSNLLLKLFAYPPLNKPSCLRRQIPFENMLIILNTLYSLMKEKSIEEKLVDWMTLMIDSSFQQILLSNDPNVLELIIKIQKDINSKYDYVESVYNKNNMMRVLKSKNVNNKKRDEPFNNLYKIEKINLY